MAKVLCMEIGVSYTKIVEMDYQVKKPKVYRCLKVNTPQGAVHDGYLDKEKMPLLEETIKEALVNHKIRTKRVLFTVFSGKIINREIQIPGVKPHQINAIIESNITEYFPMELSEYKISHMLLKAGHEGENNGKHKVLVLAIEKELLASYETLAEHMGLRLVDVDYAGNGVIQAVKHSVGAEASVVVKLEKENAIISIVQQGNLILQRNVNHARGRDISEISADEIKESLISTILRIMDFYRAGGENNSIEQIYLIGTDVTDESLAAEIEANTEVTCRTLDVVRGVTTGRNMEDVAFCEYAALIGSGVSSVGFANEKEKERNETNYVNASFLLIVFFVVAIVAMLSVSLIPYNMAVMEEKSLLKKKETYEQAQQVYNRYQGITNLYEQVEYGNKLTEHSNDGILQFLAELENKMPTEVELTEFSSDDTQCVMTMRVADKETAAGVIQQLREFDTLETVTVENVIEESENNEDKTAPGEGETTINFTVTCTYYVETLTPPASTTQDSQQTSSVDTDSVE